MSKIYNAEQVKEMVINHIAQMTEETMGNLMEWIEISATDGNWDIKYPYDSSLNEQVLDNILITLQCRGFQCHYNEETETIWVCWR